MKRQGQEKSEKPETSLLKVRNVLETKNRDKRYAIGQPRISQWRTGASDFPLQTSNSMKFQRRRINESRGQSTQSTRARCLCLPKDYESNLRFPSVWSELRLNNQFCDAEIQCGPDNHRFPIHRVILSGASPYFRALFSNNLNPNSKCELATLDAPPDMFALILEYIYTGSCHVSFDNVERLLPLADRLDVLGVVRLCCQYLLAELKPHNCLGIYKFARHYFCHNLEEQGRKYICQNFKEIVQQSTEFKEIDCEEVEEMLCDDELSVNREELVFEALKTWTEGKPKRITDLPRLLSCPRYGLMSTDYFNDNVLSWKLVQNKECKDALRPIAKYMNDRKTKQNSKIEEKLTRPRVPNAIVFTIGGWSYYNFPSNFIETYDVRANKWFLCSHVDTFPRGYHGVCSLNNLIYVIGGFDGLKYFNTVRCFDPISKEWSYKACMHYVRSYVSVCTHDGKIYALGGNNSTTRLNSCERYDPATNQWELIAPMNWPRSDADAACLGDRIYVAGGYDGQWILDLVEVYDVKTNQWSYVSSMIDSRTGSSLVAYRNSLYVLGGFNGYDRLNLCEKYNPDQDDGWQRIPEMLNERSTFASVVLDDKIYVIGGYNGILLLPFVEHYDADENQWTNVSWMNLSRSALGACVVTGLANARDYSYHGQINSESSTNLQILDPVIDSSVL